MNLLIVDDEPASRVALIRLCEHEQDMRIVGEAATGGKAIEAVETLRPDLMLLDADLPDMSGFEVLRALRRRQQRRTILMTPNLQDAPGALAAGAMDYLLKPVSEQAFSASILRARARRAPRPQDAPDVQTAALTAGPFATCTGRPLFLVGEREHRLYPLDPFEIDYVQAAGNYVTYHVAGIEYIARESIKRLDGLLVSAGFVRIERSLLLNVRAIAYAQPIGHGSFVFTLTSGARLHSGHAYRDTILAALPLRRRAPGPLPASR
ncbi:MAG TPA: LytTR family DNA-binding domain-containing protein [Steroidobacteraceae bacterium]|nr:LytTR family DNA-binding domain-containing protein [Steroidobacteraceae bacterium]